MIVWILFTVAVVAVVLYVLGKKKAAPVAVPTPALGGSVQGAITSSFVDLINAGTNVLGDWIVSKFPTTNAPLQPVPVGVTPKLSVPVNTTNTQTSPDDPFGLGSLSLNFS